MKISQSFFGKQTIAFFSVHAALPGLLGSQDRRGEAACSRATKLLKGTQRCQYQHVNFFLKLLKAKKRNEIRGGKLWEVTRVWGIDVLEVKQEPAKPEPFKKPEGGTVDAMRVHFIKGEDNVTNLTKDPDLM
jgi:hypothetical protein